jgi:hypothetical protein
VPATSDEGSSTTSQPAASEGSTTSPSSTAGPADPPRAPAAGIFSRSRGSARSPGLPSACSGYVPCMA